jgi:hypothetical protein
MMNTIKKLMILSVMGWISSANAGLSSGEVSLNNYYRDQASKQIEQILPKGKFSVQVNLKVNTSKMKADNEFQPVKLPLGGTFVSGHELKASGAIDQSIDSMIKYVEKVNIIVSIAPGISAQAQDLITNTLQSMVELDTKRGDQISFMDLPESVITAWSPEPSIEIYKKPVIILSSFFGLMLLLASIVITYGLRHVGSQISKEARYLTGTIKEAIDQSGGGMTKSAMPINSNPVNAPVINQNTNTGYESPTSQFWDKVEADTITAFCYDCISQPIYAAVPGLMVGSFLDAAKAAEVENNLPLNVLQNYNSKTTLKSAEVIQIFQKYQSEYRRAVRSPMSQQVLRVDVSTLIDFSSELKNVEVALLINSLTPMKRSSLLKVLSTDVKMDLAKASQENISIVEHKKFEISLIEKIMKLTQSDNKKEEFHSLNYLTSIILRTESFAEDEALYEKMGNKGDYRGVLLAFDYFQKSDWEEINPQDLAIAFAGYSDKFKSSVIEQFSGKKLEWVKNFFSKYEKAQPDFHSNQVEALHEFIMTKIKNIQANTGAESEQKQAV